jgi:AmiR/NasT family two-component response regulator
VGVLSVYSTARLEVDLAMLELAEARSAQHTHRPCAVEQGVLVRELQVGLTTRQQIGQACGILMSRFVLGGDEAFLALRRASQNRNVKVRELALEVIRTGTLTELDDEAQATPR